MWNCATKKHEAYKVAILKALTSLSERAELQHIKYLLNKVKSVQYTEIDKFYLEFVRKIACSLSNTEHIYRETQQREGGRSHSQTERKKNLFPDEK